MANPSKNQQRVNTSPLSIEGIGADETIESVNPVETTEAEYSSSNLMSTNLVSREVEIEAKAKGAKLESEIDNEVTKISTGAQTKMIKYSKKFLNTNLCDILEFTGDCVSFKDIIEKLEKLAESINHKDSYSTTTTRSGSDGQDGFKSPLQLQPPKPHLQNENELPSSSSIRPYAASLKSTTSSSKAPRIYQPGEVLYSKNLSPILVVPEAFTTDKKGEIFFNGLVTGVETLKTCKTTISHKRIMTPKVPTRSNTVKKVIAINHPRVKSKRRCSSSAGSLSTKKNVKKLKKGASTRSPGRAVGVGIANENEKIEYVPLKD